MTPTTSAIRIGLNRHSNYNSYGSGLCRVYCNFLYPRPIWFGHNGNIGNGNIGNGNVANGNKGNGNVANGNGNVANGNGNAVNGNGNGNVGSGNGNAVNGNGNAGNANVGSNHNGNGPFTGNVNKAAVVDPNANEAPDFETLDKLVENEG